MMISIWFLYSEYRCCVNGLLIHGSRAVRVAASTGATAGALFSACADLGGAACLRLIGLIYCVAYPSPKKTA